MKKINFRLFEINILVLISIFLFFISTLSKNVISFTAVFCVVPLIIASYRHSLLKVVLTALFWLVFAVINFKMYEYSALYLLFYFFVGIFSGEQLKRNIDVDRIMNNSYLYFFLLLIIFLSLKNIFQVEFVPNEAKEIEGFFTALIASFQKQGTDYENVVKELIYSKNQVLYIYGYIYIVLPFINQILVLLLNIYLARFLLSKYFASQLNLKKFHLWTLPDNMIWLFICSWALVVLSTYFPLKILSFAAWNLAILISIPYLIQGVEVIANKFTKWHLPVLFKLLILFFIFQLFMSYSLIVIFLILGFGLFDLWLDFRRLSIDSITQAKK